MPTHLKEISYKKGDCTSCFGLCCVALYFSCHEGFPYDKKAGEPCLHLDEAFRCRIHNTLKEKQMGGCIAFDCNGAGQITSKMYQATPWNDHKEIANAMFKDFLTVLQLQQVYNYLLEATLHTLNKDIHKEIEQCLHEYDYILQGRLEHFKTFDKESYFEKTHHLLNEVASVVMKKYKKITQKKRKTYLGYDFKHSDISGSDFSNTWMMACDLRGCKLFGTNFMGADLRDANVQGVDLSHCLFLSQGQLQTMKGNKKTKLPKHLQYPDDWK